MPSRTYPSDKKVVAGVKKHGSIRAYAHSIGVPKESLRDHIRRNEGLREKVDAVIEELQKRADEKRAAEERKRKPLPGTEISREEALEQRNRELEAFAKRERKNEVMEERIFDRLKAAIPTIEAKYQIPHVVPKEGYDEHEMVAPVSDLHAAEVVDHESTLGMNEYNWEVMLDRLQKHQKSVISYQHNRPYPVRTLHVPLLGDMLSGDIHEELRVTNDRTVEEAVVQLGYDLAEYLLGFVPHFECINVAGVPGNHPRRTKKPEAKLKHNNADWLLYNFVRALLRDHESFTWRLGPNGTFPRSGYSDIMIADRWRMLLMHGDGIRSSMPGVPWGGVIRRVTTLQSQFQKAGQPINYILLGHFHTVNAIEGVGTKTFVNGSVKGVDEYSLEKFGHGSDPSQLLLTFHPVNGITDVSYIDLLDNKVR